MSLKHEEGEGQEFLRIMLRYNEQSHNVHGQPFFVQSLFLVSACNTLACSDAFLFNYLTI